MLQGDCADAAAQLVETSAALRQAKQQCRSLEQANGDGGCPRLAVRELRAGMQPRNEQQRQSSR